jgi:hypothetical protein
VFGLAGRSRSPDEVNNQWIAFYLDYGSSIPLWLNGTAAVSPLRLPLSSGLTAELRIFQEEFERCGPDDDNQLPAELLSDGRQLLRRVKDELVRVGWDVRGAHEFAED